MNDRPTLEALLTSIAVPLVKIDGGVLYVVDATPTRVHLHVGGAYFGCPGNPYVERSLLGPLVKEIFPTASLELTSGFTIPKEAKLLETQSKA